MNSNYFMISNSLVDEASQLNLSHLEFRVLMTLSRYSNSGKDNCYPSFATIAATCCASDKGVRRAVKSLIAKQLIRKLSKGSNLKGLSNVYEVSPLGIPFSIKTQAENTLQQGRLPVTNTAYNIQPAEHQQGKPATVPAYDWDTSEFEAIYELATYNRLEWLTAYPSLDKFLKSIDAQKDNLFVPLSLDDYLQIYTKAIQQEIAECKPLS